MSRFRDFVFYVIRSVGGFGIAQRLTRNRLRILCYHGFSVGDEYQVQPHMFMRAATFERRLRILKRRRLPVIPLDEAARRLEAGQIASSETVITVDDGWASTLTIAAPILERYGFPAAVYLTTEHLIAGTEVFNVALYYMISRSPRDTLQLTGLHPALDGTHDLRKDRYRLTLSLISAAEKAFPALAERQRALPTIASALGVNLAEVLRDERFRLLSRSQVRELAARGFAVELHTHSHRLPVQSFEMMAAEVATNRSALEALLGTRPRHFCFPSGQYAPQHPEWLRRLGIISATTCDPGLNPPGTCMLLLKRYLDSDRTSDIAFEAEVSGFRELLRQAMAVARLRRSQVQPASGHSA